MEHSLARDQWTSKLGVMLAVAGSAVGFGNFLRFPGLAAEYGGGAFMIAYLIAFVVLGIPLCWIEWALGRASGRLGGHSPVSMFLLLSRSHAWKYFGIFMLIIPLTVSMYYLYLEGWTLGYFYHTLMGDLQLDESGQYGAFFAQFTGLAQDGAAFDLGLSWVMIFTAIALFANFIILYRGINKGIEWFSKWSMPALLVLSVIMLVRVLTLDTPDPSHPERNINEGLGYMWNPNKTMLVVEGKTVEMLPAQASAAQQEALVQRVEEQHAGKAVEKQQVTLIEGLKNPELWLAAASQIFFSLSVGFGTISTYASYVSKSRDIALSSLTANATNEFVEVGIAGLMIIPAAIAFLGVAAAAGMGTFGLGFEVLPQVFAQMPAGQYFGAMFFLLLFLAAVASSLSLLQPGIAFFEDFWHLTRAQSVVLIGVILSGGTLIVSWFTGDGLLALETMNFFFGTLLLFAICIAMLLLFRNKMTTQKGLAELREGALMRLPRGLGVMINWITPAALIAVFVAWLYKNLFETQNPLIAKMLEGAPGVIMPLIWGGMVIVFLIFVVKSSSNLQGPHTREETPSEEDEIHLP